MLSLRDNNLQKPFRDQDLIDRIQRALEKDRTNRAVLDERSLIRERLDSLTPREREVLKLRPGLTFADDSRPRSAMDGSPNSRRRRARCARLTDTPSEI
jgi:DNA-directed RNA polymerase sigma subunit (sigma70/sigma32)